MYSTCLFCNRDLGGNEIIELLPVGRRIAFDPGQGRLWVICRGCEKWNLVPFDVRLEVIEICERLYRSTRTRFATDNIGIARLAEGLELVRIGPALRPEFAAWRYGDQFGRRRKRAFLVTGGAIILVGGIYLGGAALGVSAGLLSQTFNVFNMGYQNRTVATRLPGDDSGPTKITRAALRQARLRWHADDLLELKVAVRSASPRMRERTSGKKNEILLQGEEAVRALAGLLPVMNSSGGSRSTVDNAVALVETTRDAERMLRMSIPRLGDGTPLAKVGVHDRLALEMILNEESERRALAGELSLLERQWKEAERLARIADDLALPEQSGEDLDRLRRGGT